MNITKANSPNVEKKPIAKRLKVSGNDTRNHPENTTIKISITISIFLSININASEPQQEV